MCSQIYRSKDLWILELVLIQISEFVSLEIWTKERET